MKKIILMFVTPILLSSIIACSSSNNNTESDQSGHAFDSTNTMYDDGQSMYDTLDRDTLSTDSLIPPTPMENQN